MALDKLVDSTQLDSDLTSVADAIRTKGGTSAQLAFPAGFVSAIDAIPTGGGGKQPVAGTFTISTTVVGNCPAITHNFGTKKIAAIIYPGSSIDAAAGYRLFYAAYINVPELVDNGSWSLDFTSYNSAKFPDVVSVDPKNSSDAAYIRDVSRQSSPWTTQSHWYDANNEATFNSNATLTDNTVRLFPNITWALGTYKYIVYDLS